MSLLDCRGDFFDFAGATYLNCAYQGPLPRRAVAALERAVELKTRPHLIHQDDYFEIPDGYRRSVGELIGAEPAEIAVTDSTTYGLSLLARGLDWKPGDEVVLPRGEFPANRIPWLALERRGVRVREIELPPGDRGVESLSAAISSRSSRSSCTRVFAAAWVRYQTGERRDVVALGRLCRERGVLFAIDGSQGIGGLPFDLRRVPCDLLACSGYKWMLGPYGLGFAWVSPALAERLDPPAVNWFAVRGARDFSRLGECELVWEPGARRFDVNETANFFNLLSGTAALRYLLELGVERASSHVAELQRRLRERLPEGFSVVGSSKTGRGSNIVCLTAAEQLLARAGRRLDVLRVAVSRREGAIRVSPFIYNTTGDIDRLVEGLRRAAEG